MAQMNRNVNLEEIDSDALFGIEALKNQTLVQKIVFFGCVLLGVLANVLFIVIEIPEYFKSGYYFINGVGLFRYVSDKDADTYNKEAYDASIDWNDPIIIYDENGEVIFDPSQPEYYGNKYQESDSGMPWWMNCFIPKVNHHLRTFCKRVLIKD